MNRIVFGLVFAYQFFVLCHVSNAQEKEIDFTVKGIPDKEITLGYHMGGQKYALDTLPIVNESFSIINSEELKPGLYFVYTPGYYFEFILSEQSFSIQTVHGKGYEDVNIGGSLENQIFREFQINASQLRQELFSLKNNLDQASANDSLEIVEQIRMRETALVDYRQSVIDENPGTFMADFLNLMQEPKVPDFGDIVDDQSRKVKQYQYYKSHFFDLVNLAEPALIRTPIFKSKVMKYFDQVIIQDPDTIVQEVDFIFEEIGDNNELFRYWLITFYSKYQESKVMGMDKVVVHLMEHYFLSGRADWLNEEGIKKIREEVMFTKHSLIGNEAPRLELVDTLNQPFIFEQIQHPYVLLYFYDPDCGHCKKKTPILVSEYDALRDLGVEVVAVCTVTDVERWKAYIKEVQMEFINLADPGFDSNFRVYYNLRSTPKVYLLDQQRRIIAKQLEIADIKEFVKRYSQ